MNMMKKLKSSEKQEIKKTTEVRVVLNQLDTPHERCMKMMQYAGFVNPNRIGSVDAMAIILHDYMVLDGVIKQDIKKQSE